MNLNRQITNWLGILILFTSVDTAAQGEQLQEEIRKIIQYERMVDFDLVPGILVGVIDGDTTYISGFGQSLSPDSLYEIGSVTKPLTAFLVQLALDSLGWTTNASVCDFLPDSICSPSLRTITIEDVLTHQCGWPRLPRDNGAEENLIGDPYANFTEQMLGEELGQLESISGQFSYSHLGYASFLWLFDKLGGTEKFSLYAFMEKLNLSNTEWNPADSLIAQGHGIDGRPNPVWHSHALQTAFGLKSTMNDMIRFVRGELQRFQGKISSKGTGLKKEINTLSKQGAYKMMEGWFLIQSGPAIVCFHAGRTGGHYVSVAFVPDVRKGVVVISNGALGTDDLSLRILEMIRRAG